jgi:5-methylcytosine-specific restriction enzyme A
VVENKLGKSMKYENTAQRLKKEWNVEVRHQLYSKDGTAYERLQKFPGALFDENGYIVFQTEEDYIRCPVVNIQKKVSIHGGGISKIPGYVFVNAEWSDHEYTLIVKEYLSSLNKLESGQDANIFHIIQSIVENEQISKSEKSIVQKLRNISFTLTQFCKPHILEIKPLHDNYGVHEKISKILSLLNYIDLNNYEPAPEGKNLNKKVQIFLQTSFTGKPQGIKSPIQTQTTVSNYLRDPLVKAWIIQNANGSCELCGNPAPFLSPENQPYLESHHVKTLADGGPDTIENTVALCPNCHRACHYGKEKITLQERLLFNIERLIQF